MIKILYEDTDIIFCIKPVGMSSETDLPQALGSQTGSDVYAVHRLDTPVGGVMVYAKNSTTASKLSKKIAENSDFEKTYLAVCEGEFENPLGDMEDLLFKDSRKNKSFVVKKERKGVKSARLSYRVIATADYKDKKCSLVAVALYTGRSHQIRVQFASRKHPLLGDGKYGSKINCPIGLFSHKISTCGIEQSAVPEDVMPWSVFDLNTLK